jgi:hypothetical protein
VSAFGGSSANNAPLRSEKTTQIQRTVALRGEMASYQRPGSRICFVFSFNLAPLRRSRRLTHPTRCKVEAGFWVGVLKNTRKSCYQVMNNTPIALIYWVIPHFYNIGLTNLQLNCRHFSGSKMEIDWIRWYKLKKDCNAPMDNCSYNFQNHDNKVKKHISESEVSGCSNILTSKDHVESQGRYNHIRSF